MRPLSLLLAVALIVCGAALVEAQPPPTIVDADASPGFLTRYGLLASMEALSAHEVDFYWDADITVDADIVDYGRGRAALLFNYETVMGAQLQPFDPRQNNYTLEALGTWRQGRTEWGGLLRHVSRHLGDRRKDFGIAWNDLGLQVRHLRSGGPWTWQARGEVLGTVARSFVDYRALTGGDLVVRRRLSTRTSLVGSAAGRVRFVQASPVDRGTQTGWRAEIGVRVEGKVAAVELVGGGERRIDADPFDFAPLQWAFAGLRIVSR